MRSLASLSIRLLTHNIRYATTSPFKGEEVWEIRMPRLVNELRFNTFYNSEAFICLQEVLHPQLHDIMSALNSKSDANLNLNSGQGDPTGTGNEWSYIGVGRDDGKTAGEYSPIIYRPAIWSLQDWKTVWLSETPDQPSKGWDAASIRILTVGVFKHRQSGWQIVAMNTHLDDQGSVARLNAANMIVNEMGVFAGSISKGKGLPVFLAGDLNSESTQEAFKVLNREDSPVTDAMGMAEDRVYGNVNTFTGFGQEGEPQKRIDFLFVGKEGDWTVQEYAVLENRFEDGVYCSDHRAVVGDFVLDI